MAGGDEGGETGRPNTPQEVSKDSQCREIPTESGGNDGAGIDIETRTELPLAEGPGLWQSQTNEIARVPTLSFPHIGEPKRTPDSQTKQPFLRICLTTPDRKPSTFSVVV